MQICERVGRPIPKGTLSYICKDVVLPESYYVNLREAERARLVELRKKAAIANKRLKVERFMMIYEGARRAVASSSELNQQKINLAILHKGEGSKYDSGYHGLALGNSDARVLKLYISLLERCYGIKHEQFRCRLMGRGDQDMGELQKYWSKELAIPPRCFYKSYLDARTLGKPTKRLNYQGVCVVSCKGADIQVELEMIADLYADKLWGISSFG